MMKTVNRLPPREAAKVVDKMNRATIRVESLVIPTYPEPEHEPLPMFAENRVHQRSSGRPYPNRVTLEVDRTHRQDRAYQAVHLENEYLDVWVLPEIGGRIYAARDKSTGYDFFYRQHVIKPALIGALGSWVSGGVEFNWPYHHRASGFMPCDFSTEEAADGSVICWLSEHDPVDRMKSLVGIVLRPDAAYLETRVKLCNRTPTKKSFLWWENAAVPVNESYQIFFPHDVTYVNFHYLDSRISYPVAGAGVFNGIDMSQPRDISWHKNTRDATSYFACASKYDFFGGYDHGLGCGVVHIGNHHISPGKKMFTWAYNQLSRSWEKALTDSDGQYAELMAGSYTDNQPNFSWLEPYETKQFSQYWYPISRIGAPDYANLDCALKLEEEQLCLQATRALGPCTVEVRSAGELVLSLPASLSPCEPVFLPWARPAGPVSVRVVRADGVQAAFYQEEEPDRLKMPPVKDPLPLPSELQSADRLYLAGVHVEQYRDPAVMPDAYWLEALKRDPCHAPSLLGMARYSYTMLRFEAARGYAERAIRELTRFNERTENGDAYYLYALILEQLDEPDLAYDYYYKAAWSGSAVPMAMARLACLDLRRGDWAEAAAHARQALERDAQHPLAPAALVLACAALGQAWEAQQAAAAALDRDPFNLLVRYLSGMPEEQFFGGLSSSPSQAVLDLAADLDAMGQRARIIALLEGLLRCRPEEGCATILYTLAYYRGLEGGDCAGPLRRAEDAPLGQTYPFRPIEARALRAAVEQGSARAPFLLGCLLYDKRHYPQAAELFEEALRRDPGNYMAYRSLAVACFSHLDRGEEALPLMHRAMSLHPDAQLLYETVVLMDKLGCAPAEKIALLESRPQLLGRDDLLTELAKACNQDARPQQALEVLGAHTFVPCEGGEHAIADQYMFAHYLRGMEQLTAGRPEEAAACFTAALTLPENLGAGIWNRCKYVPYRYRIAECLEQLGGGGEAAAFYREILDIQVDFFSKMHLRELPFYQAMAARRLGEEQRACAILSAARREWAAELERVDGGFFSTTPFFISFTDDPARLRRAQYLYLLALTELFQGHDRRAREMFRESLSLNSDNLFCGYFAQAL